jgi:hypothetical protein
MYFFQQKINLLAMGLERRLGKIILHQQFQHILMNHIKNI